MKNPTHVQVLNKIKPQPTLIITEHYIKKTSNPNLSYKDKKTNS